MLNKGKVLDTLLILLIIIFSGNSLPFMFTPQFALIIPFVIILFYSLTKYRIDSLIFGKIFPVLTFFAILIFIYFIKFNSFNPLFILRFFLLIGIAYLYIYRYSINFFFIFERLVFVLSLLALPIFFIQLVNFGLVLNLISFIQKVIFLGSSETENYATMLLYTVSWDEGDIQRNCGFCWEPGPYSCFLSISIFFYLYQKLLANEKLDYKFPLYLLFLATTTSPTGIVSTAFIIIWYFYNKNVLKSIIVLATLLIVLGLLYLNFDIFSEKIERELTSSEEIFEGYQIQYSNDRNASIGRVPGILMNIEDFKRNPIFGYGGQFEETYARINELLITSTSGIGNWLAEFGIVGSIVFIILWYKTFKKFSTQINSKGLMFLMASIFTIGFAFNIIFFPFFFIFMFYGQFSR